MRESKESRRVSGLKDEQILLFVFGSVTLRSVSECLEDARPRAPARQTNEPSNGIFNHDLSEVATGVHRESSRLPEDRTIHQLTVLQPDGRTACGLMHKVVLGSRPQLQFVILQAFRPREEALFSKCDIPVERLSWQISDLVACHGDALKQMPPALFMKICDALHRPLYSLLEEVCGALIHLTKGILVGHILLLYVVISITISQYAFSFLYVSVNLNSESFNSFAIGHRVLQLILNVFQQLFTFSIEFVQSFYAFLILS